MTDDEYAEFKREFPVLYLDVLAINLDSALASLSNTREGVRALRRHLLQAGVTGAPAPSPIQGPPGASEGEGT